MKLSFSHKLDAVISFYGWKKLLKIGINAVIPNRSSVKVAFNKANYNDYYYFRKRYANKVKAYDNSKYNGKTEKVVWTLWLQGEERAPEIVRACWNSVRKYLPKGYRLVILDKKSLAKYIKLPDFIEELYSRGIMKMAHYSDLARIKLLLEYGGYWIDSTVYCTNSDLFDFIDETNPPLFVYRNMLRCDDGCAISNWFIYSRPENNILRNVYSILIDYWSSHKGLKNYFQFHIIFAVVVDQLADEWAKVPVMNNVNPHVLAGQLFEPYKEEYFNLLGKTSSLHKLSYRIEESDIEKDDTNYHHIITTELGEY